ncbi:hypothetical protein K439DRAFT_307693 [Ramaria rubella]|nr:hypothetical protein K439DRAFT_307693 [Ramaria rubella]
MGGTTTTTLFSAFLNLWHLTLPFQSHPILSDIAIFISPPHHPSSMTEHRRQPESYSIGSILDYSITHSITCSTHAPRWNMPQLRRSTNLSRCYGRVRWAGCRCWCGLCDAVDGWIPGGSGRDGNINGKSTRGWIFWGVIMEGRICGERCDKRVLMKRKMAEMRGGGK